MYFLVGLYLAAIVAANLSVAALGPAVSVINAFLFIALDLSSRDRLHEVWHGQGLVWKMGGLIVAGSVLSWALNRSAGAIALASCAAFAASASADALIYHALRRRAYLVKTNGSNLVGAAVDSLIFPILAFGWPPLWPIIAGQFVAKLVGGAAWSLLLRPRRAEVEVVCE